MRQRLEHRDVDGRPTGILTTVERLKYLGYIDGKPAYQLSALEHWKGTAVTLLVLLVLLAGYLWLTSTGWHPPR